jgi:hypothetical protein
MLNVAITFFVPNISVAGHLGGGAFGAIVALLLNVQRFGKPFHRQAALSALIMLPVLSVAVVVVAPKPTRPEPPQKLPSLGDLLGTAVDVFNEAERAYADTIYPVAQKLAKDRTAEETALAQKTLEKHLGELVRIKTALEENPTGKTPKIEELRQAMLDCLKEQSEFFLLLELKLTKRDAWLPAQDEELKKKSKDLKAARTRWSQLVDGKK